MTKNTDKIFNIIQSDIKFWLAIISVIIGVVIAFQLLSARVLASEVKIESDHTLLMQIDDKMDASLINQEAMQKDIEYLVKNNN